jgi:hypothetical protein
MGRKRVGGLAAIALAVVMIATGCRPMGDGGHGNGGPPSTDEGGLGAGWYAKARQRDYLEFATQSFSPTSVTNVINHAERARRDPSFHFDASAVTP